MWNFDHFSFYANECSQSQNLQLEFESYFFRSWNGTRMCIFLKQTLPWSEIGEVHPCAVVSWFRIYNAH